MECNKDEAIRAKQIAEGKMQKGDFSAARKIARKAQQLFPELDNVSQMLTVCDVHCSAQNKILGSEMDWYGVLQVEQSADEITIKKQFRKLALFLHPDKNKFSGAEAAFKLIGEAHRVLSDKTKRSVYDVKLRAAARTSVPKPQPQQSQRNPFIKKQHGPASNFPNGPHPQYGTANAIPKAPYSRFTGSPPLQNAQEAFWTRCSTCGIRYQYYRKFVNRVLRCQSCKQSFTAYDLGTQGVPPGFTWSQFPNQNLPNSGVQKGFRNPGPSKVASQSKGRKPCGILSKQKAAFSMDENLPNKKSKTEEGKEMGKEADIADHDDKKFEVNDISKVAVYPRVIEYPDADFTDFDKDKAENCFAVNQVWAIYDTWDGMPRFYARIKKVFSPGFKLRITWLEPDPDDENEIDWCDADLPVACGKFMNGYSEETEDLLMFSHQITLIEGVGRRYLIYPKVGETWAIFRDWDSKWSSDLEKHKPSYQFDFVEVLTDFNGNTGIGVAYLGKVKGYVSLFQRIAQNAVLSVCVKPLELYRFSHRIPSVRMTGKERTGVPVGSFELDPASLPTYLHKPVDPADVKIEKKKLRD